MPTPQNGLTHSNNSSTTPDELFECVWSFCGVGNGKIFLEVIFFKKKSTGKNVR